MQQDLCFFFYAFKKKKKAMHSTRKMVIPQGLLILNNPNPNHIEGLDYVNTA